LYVVKVSFYYPLDTQADGNTHEATGKYHLP